MMPRVDLVISTCRIDAEPPSAPRPSRIFFSALSLCEFNHASYSSAVHVVFQAAPPIRRACRNLSKILGVLGVLRGSAVISWFYSGRYPPIAVDPT